MAEKPIINIVYAPGKGAPSKVYENKHGEIWQSNKYDPNKINIGMGWYSIRHPQPGDSILVVEPCCILERDYQINFVKHFDHIFTWAAKAFANTSVKDKVVEIVHPTYHKIPGLGISQSWNDWSKRQNNIVFVANNKSSRHHSELYSFRLMLADMLHHRSKFNVEWYGQIPIKRPFYKGPTPDKHKMLLESKFSVCTENSYDHIFTHNYFTEKMPDVWKAGAVPIYFGCYNINEFGLPKKSYIDLRDYCRKEGNRWKIEKEKLLHAIETFSEDDYNDYTNCVKNKILGTSKFHDLTAFEHAHKKMINTFRSKP
jgi:hypothetical protein